MENTKGHLCIEISDAFCSLSEISEGKVRALGSLFFREKKDFQLREALAAFLKEKAGELSDYSEVSVSWIHILAQLIPSAVFEPKAVEDLFTACFTREPGSTELDYNRISELSVVNIYEIPRWVKSFFVMKFPRAVIQHEYSHQLRGVIRDAFRLNIQANIYPERMSVQIAERNELLFCNTYEIQHLNDALYYLTFALQQLQLKDKTGKLNFHLQGNADITPEDLSKSLRQIDLFSQLEIRFDSEKTIKYHQLCV